MMKKFFGTSAVGAMLMLATVTPALADNATSTSGTATSTPAKPTVDIACIQTAVDKRETAIGAGVDALTMAWKSALSSRQSALKAAWQMTDRKQRRTALLEAWKAFRRAMLTARKDHRSATRNAWKGYNSDRRACGTGAASDDRTSEGVDQL